MAALSVSVRDLIRVVEASMDEHGRASAGIAPLEIRIRPYLEAVVARRHGNKPLHAFELRGARVAADEVILIYEWRHCGSCVGIDFVHRVPLTVLEDGSKAAIQAHLDSTEERRSALELAVREYQDRERQHHEILLMRDLVKKYSGYIDPAVPLPDLGDPPEGVQPRLGKASAEIIWRSEGAPRPRFNESRWPIWF